jgi:peroxiredoxin
LAVAGVVAVPSSLTMAPDPTSASSPDEPASSPRPPASRRPSRLHLALSVAIALVVAALSAVVLSVVLEEEPEATTPMANLTAAKPAPTTPFQKLGGGEASLADYAGTPIVLNFFAKSCVPCRKEMPDLQRIHDEVGDRVVVLGVNQGDTEEDAAAFVQELGVTYPIGRDPSGDFARELGVDSLPGTVFITRQGDIVGLHRGQLTYDNIRQLVDEHLR